jgi:hypothetical protein
MLPQVEAVVDRESSRRGELASPTLAKRAPTKVDFDPYIGVICAESWWDLGKLLAHRTDPAWIAKKIPFWTKDSHPDFKGNVTVESVQRFAVEIYDLLRRKFNDEPIAAEAQAIGRRAAQAVYRDAGPMLELDETSDVFWAIETKFVLDDLCRPFKLNAGGWLEAVDVCRECEEFFVKQRRDQIFDTAKCRTKFANRDAYLRRRRVGGRHH